MRVKLKIFTMLGSVCGNNVIEPGEICDGTSLNSQTCSTQGFADGTLKCNPSCTAYDATLCYN